jgi:hypothetical protein
MTTTLTEVAPSELPVRTPIGQAPLDPRYAGDEEDISDG